MVKQIPLLVAVSLIGVSGCSRTTPQSVTSASQGKTIGHAMVDAVTGNARGSRDSARTLRGQADKRIVAGDYKGAMDKRLQMLDVRGKDPSTFGALTSYAIQQMALGDLAKVASHLDAASCVKYAAQLKATDGRTPTYTAMLRNDKAAKLKKFSQLARTPQEWQKIIVGLGFSGQQQQILNRTPVAQIRANIEKIYDARIKWATQPYSTKKVMVSVDPYTSYITSYSTLDRFLWAKHKTDRLLTIVALQERADRLQKKKRAWGLPADPFGAGTLKEKNGVVYSVGPDMKDDGGKSVPQPGAVQVIDQGDIPAPSF